MAQKVYKLNSKHQYALEIIAKSGDYEQVEFLKKKIRKTIQTYFAKAEWCDRELLREAATDMRTQAQMLEAAYREACRGDKAYTTLDRPLYTDDLYLAMPDSREKFEQTWAKR